MKLPTIIIPRRFCGPPFSGNGGYTSGLLSQVMGCPVEVTLRKPIPIEKELRIHPREDAPGVLLKDEVDLIAEAAPAEWPLETVPAVSGGVSFEAAVEASQHSPALGDHPFPTCFTCGPARAAGDGLRVFPGPLPAAPERDGNALFASPWVPDASFAGEDGMVRPEIIWAALDCPTGFAAGFPTYGTLVTGRLGARLLAPVRPEEKCVLLSWGTGVDGRKHHAAGVLLGEDGSVRAQVRATWIKIG